MAEDSTVFVGIDAAKAKHAVAVAEPGRNGEVRYLGEIEASPEAVRKLLTRLAVRHGELHVCYEAGPTGYGLYRQVVGARACLHRGRALADPTQARRPGEDEPPRRSSAGAPAAGRRADPGLGAGRGARGHARPGARTGGGGRGPAPEAPGHLLHAAEAWAGVPGEATWGARHERWLAEQAFDHPAQQVVLQELVLAARHAKERLERIEAAIAEFLPGWSLAPVVEALQALRGIRLATAATIVAEVGDLRRFDNARQFMGYLGLVPGERSTGETVRRLGITKAGNGRVGGRSSRARGPTGTRRGSGRRSSTSSSASRPRCATSPGRRSRGCAPATGRSRRGARS